MGFTVFQAKPGLGGSIRLHLSADHNSARLLSVCHDIQRPPHNIEFVNSRDDAYLELSVRDNQIVVSIRDVKATVYRLDHKFPTMQATPHDLTSFLEKRGASIGNAIVIQSSTQKWQKSSP